MDWNASEISLYVDDILLNSIDVNEALYPKGVYPQYPFLQAHYLVINLAIGGSQGGDPSNTEFPTTYEIDYVRVYQ
ncbi:MAG: hypothetical protein ACJAVV_003469 [Alphaproteobacteria bacterium]|jgi:hypothetical protein